MFDPNDSIDCSPVERRHQKILNRKNRRKFRQEKKLNEPTGEISDSITTNPTALKVEHPSTSNINIFHDIQLMAKADRLPAIQMSRSIDLNQSEIFLTASQFRDTELFPNNLQVQSDNRQSLISELCSPIKYSTNAIRNENYTMRSDLSTSYLKVPTNIYCIEIFNDFTEMEDYNFESPTKCTLSPPPFRCRRKNLRTYNGPKVKLRLMKSPESKDDIDSSEGSITDFGLLNSSPLSPIQLKSTIAQSSHNISKNILDLSLIYCNRSINSIDSFNFETQSSLESTHKPDIKIQDDQYLNKHSVRKQISFESDDDEAINLENNLILSSKSNSSPFPEAPSCIDYNTLKLSFKLAENDIAITENKNKSISESGNDTKKLNKKSEYKVKPNITVKSLRTRILPKSKEEIKQNRNHINSKSRHTQIGKADNKNTMLSKNCQTSQYLTPIGEFLNESNERQSRIYEKMCRITVNFNENSSSDDEDFRGFDNNEIENEHCFNNINEIYEKSTQNLLNEYLEQDLDVFDEIDESHYSTNSTKNNLQVLNVINGETQSLLNDSFMNCPSVLKDVDVLLNKVELNESIEKYEPTAQEHFFGSELWLDDDVFRNIETQDFIKDSKNIIDNKFQENLNYSNRINFKTPTRPPLKTKIQNLISNDTNLNKPVIKFEGFKCVSGKNIKISSEAVNKAKIFMANVFNEIENNTIISNEISNEQLVGESSNTKFLKEPFTFLKEKDMYSKEEENSPQNFSGFKFVSGKTVQISSQAMKKANRFLTETYTKIEEDLNKNEKYSNKFELSEPYETKVNGQLKVDGSYDKHNVSVEKSSCASPEKLNSKKINNNTDKEKETPKFEGFKFVSGRKIHITDEAIKRANNFLLESFNNEIIEKTEPNLNESKNELSFDSVDDKTINVSKKNCEIIDKSIKEISSNDSHISKRKIEASSNPPQKIFKFSLSDNTIRKHQLEECNKNDSKTEYEVALSIGKTSTSKSVSNPILTLNTPKSNSTKLSLNSTPITTPENKSCDEFSTPNLKQFYNSIIRNNKSTPQPGISPLNDAMSINISINSSDLDKSITPKRGGPSVKMRIDRLKKMNPRPPALSPACYINNSKPSGLRIRKSRLSFSKTPKTS